MCGQERAIRGSTRYDVPKHGTPWTEATAKNSPGKDFKGDQVLARSVSFIREALFSREMDHATADGDVGRLWEVIKVMVFTFAGSSHSNYTKYLLEMITNLELECTPELRRALLQISLVNLTGRDGHWSAGDFIQEYFNRLLEAIVHQKGVEYGDKFIRQVWSRNIHHVARLKISWFDGSALKDGRPDIKGLVIRPKCEFSSKRTKKPSSIHSAVDEALPLRCLWTNFKRE